MPAPNYRGLSHPYLEAKLPTLDHADGMGQFVRAGCARCKTIHLYRPADIKTVVGGDMHVFRLREKLRCEQCGKRDEMVVEFKTFLGNEMVGLVVRELVEIRTVKKPIWREKRL